MKEEKLLPIGTVVMLKGGTKKVMITGFCVISEDNQSKIYDYCGCLYPEGYVAADKNLLFDHSQIDKIYYTGLIDEEEKEFKKQLVDILNKLHNN